MQLLAGLYVSADELVTSKVKQSLLTKTAREKGLKDLQTVKTLAGQTHIYSSSRFIADLMRRHFSSSCGTQVCSRRFEFDKLDAMFDSHTMSSTTYIGFYYQEDSSVHKQTYVTSFTQ